MAYIIGNSMDRVCLTANCNDITEEELKDLQEELKNYCCSVCGFDLQLLRIPAEKEEDERLELLCTRCRRLDVGTTKKEFRKTMMKVANMPTGGFY